MDDSKRTLYGDLLVRYLACNKLKIHNNELVFCYNEFGKPFLKNYSDFHFNISHSGVWVVCEISKKKVGIDIEQMKWIDLDIAKRFLSESEYKMLMSQPEYARTEYFYNLWTLKESYIKCVGKGLPIPLNHFSISFDDHLISIVPTTSPAMYFSQIFLDNEYKLSVCSEVNNLYCKIILINIII